MYLPKRDELSFLVVFAFPNASMMGFVARIWRSVSDMPSLSFDAFLFPGRSGSSTVAKYRIMYFAETVLPAPDSPDTMMVWLRWSRIMHLYASSAMANRWGSSWRIVRQGKRRASQLSLKSPLCAPLGMSAGPLTSPFFLPA